MRAFILAALSTLAAAVPTPASSSPSASPSAFGIISIRSGSSAQYAGWQAEHRSLVAGTSASQNASCDNQGSNDNFATFRIENGELFLYSTGEPQKFFVDRSGMGQGVIQYTTGAEQPPANAETKGWTLSDEGYGTSHLQFAGSDFFACPGTPWGGFSIWADTGASAPGGNQNCLGIAARVVSVDSPVSCQYTQ